MIVMAKKKPIMKGRSRERGDTVTFTFEMTPELDRAFEALAKRDMRTKKAVLTMALQGVLKSQGLWPPQPGGDDA
jgi:hypothetical protein